MRERVGYFMEDQASDERKPRFTYEQWKDADAQIRAQVAQDIAENPLRDTTPIPKSTEVPPQFVAKRTTFTQETGLNPDEHDGAFIHWLMTQGNKKAKPTADTAAQLSSVREQLTIIEGGKLDTPVVPAARIVDGAAS